MANSHSGRVPTKKPPGQAALAAPTSAGMTPELTHLFLATELAKETEGGGTEHEDIRVHLVPRAELRGWLKAKEEAEGLLVDFKIHASLWAAAL